MFDQVLVTFCETGILRVLFGLLFWSTEKVSHNDSQKGLPGGPQEGSLCSDSSILTFAAGPKQGSKMEPKWSVLGAKVITILPFLRPCD